MSYKMICIKFSGPKRRKEQINLVIPDDYRVKLKDYIMVSLAKWVECSPMVRETWVQSQVASYQRL